MQYPRQTGTDCLASLCEDLPTDGTSVAGLGHVDVPNGHPYVKVKIDCHP